MKITIEFNEEDDKMYIDYIKKLDREEKRELKEEAKYAIYNMINEEFDREKRAKENWEKMMKQQKCEHDFKEVDRSRYDYDGEPYVDEDGEFMTAECVSYHCKKCDATTSKMDYSNPHYE
ncbi:hypothetical protein [Bacillus cereus group sp. BceL008]|uniref:hypothetical protein n=1 Tax=Bacillus cereus group sp. BceL008 TaxID=3445220 RepID=UPI003F1F8FF2